MELRPVRLHLCLLLSAMYVLSPAAGAQLNGRLPGQSAAPVNLPAGKLPIADPYASEPLVIELNETAYRMHADGTGERSLHMRLRLHSEGAVRQFSVLSFSYASASETPHILRVQVHKPDGAVIESPVAEAIEMPAPVTREAPLYSDVKEKQLPVRSLAVGDTLEYEVRTTIDKPEAPGQFWGADHFTAPAAMVVLSEVYILEFPRDKYVQVWSPNHQPVKTEHDNLVRYTWTVSQLLPTPTQAQQSDAKTRAPKDPDQDAEGRIIPSLAYTTFHNWAEVGDWYRGLAAARAEPTDALRAKANDLTRGVNTPEEQARALYRYVSAIRYVGIDLGAGRFQPHPAAEVLADQYGDCKDKDTLLEALMRSKGLHPAPALVGAGITPLPDVPTPAVFNHVITTLDLPGTGRVWMDSTAETAPFRLLNAVIRDEEALVVPLSSPAELIKTPADAPYPFYNRFDATGTITGDGLLKAHIEMVFHSDEEAALRGGLQQLAPSQWDAGAQYLSSGMGFSGKASNADLHQKAPDDPLHLSYDYTREKYSDWSNLRILPMAPALTLPEPDADDPTPTDINLGAKATQIVSTRLTLPEGFRADLPDGVHAASPWATYDKTYRLTDGVIVFDRKLVILATKVPKADLTAYSAFLRKISNGQEYYIQLTAPHHLVVVPSAPAAKPSSGKSAPVIPVTPATPAHAAPSQDPEELVQQAMQLVPSMDWPRISSLLDQAKDISDSTPYLWAGYGVVQAAQRNYAASIPLYRRELSRHPDEGRVIVQLSLALKADNQDAAAQTLLSDYFRDHTDDRMVALMLAASQTSAHHYTDAAQTLQQASTALPKDESLKVQLANTLLLSGDKPAAGKAAREALDAAEPDDSGTLNDAGYALAESGIDLPFAEQSSRKAVTLLEAKSLSLTPEEVNSRSYADSNLLVASWDTLGYILLVEAKLDQALNWLGPAWRDCQHPEVGLHLGQVYEKQGRVKDALMTYRLALASSEGAHAEDVMLQLGSSVSRLHGSVNTQKAKEELQDDRMFRVKRPSNLAGSATYRLLLATTGVVGLEQVSGDPGMKAAEPAIRDLKFPELIPSGSQVHLLRRIVVSCHSGDTCQLVFVPNSSLSAEQD